MSIHQRIAIFATNKPANKLSELEREAYMRAVHAVARHYMHKPDPFAYAKQLLQQAPQTWAYAEAQIDWQQDGFRLTQKRKDALWRALGGKD